MVNKPLSVLKWFERPNVERPNSTPVRFCLLLFVVVLLFAVVLSGCSNAQTPAVLAAGESGVPVDGVGISAPDIRGPQTPNATVVHITDGDTISVHFTARVGNSDESNEPDQSADLRETVRLIGIDTPESKRPNTPIECFALVASSALTQLLPEGTPVRVELDVEHRDRYGRLLGYIFRATDGLFVNHEMVRSGMAAAYAFPPNITYADQFSSASGAARANNVGLWSSCESEHEPAPTQQ
jgi:micrococcal nuclease